MGSIVRPGSSIPGTSKYLSVGKIKDVMFRTLQCSPVEKSFGTVALQRLLLQSGACSGRTILQNVRLWNSGGSVVPSSQCCSLDLYCDGRQRGMATFFRRSVSLCVCPTWYRFLTWDCKTKSRFYSDSSERNEGNTAAVMNEQDTCGDKMSDVLMPEGDQKSRSSKGHMSRSSTSQQARSKDHKTVSATEQQTRSSSLLESVSSETEIPSDHIDIPTAAEIQTAAEAAIAKTSQTDKWMLSYSVQTVEDTIKYLSDFFTLDRIQQMLIARPELMKCAKYKPGLDHLKSYQFDELGVQKVLTELENLQLLKQNRIEAVFESLRLCGFQDEQLCRLMGTEPNILTLNGKDIISRIYNLKSFFKQADVLNLALNCPSILLDNLEDIIEKFDYAFNKMKVSQRQIIYSNLFAHSLNHVKHRHLFLVRAGLFFEDEKLKTRNPRLQDIVDLTDLDFVKRYGEISVTDYKTFCKLVQKEHSSKELDDDYL